MQGETSAFDFRQSVSIIKSTGIKAANVRELQEAIRTISELCLFHHTYQYFMKGHILEYTNDFAQWAGESLEDTILAEQLSSIDPYRFESIEKLRQEVIRTIDYHLANFPEPREAVPGDEFFFNESVTLIFREGVRARNLAEFLMAIKYVDQRSIYFHFYEARSRTGAGTDDFSHWFEEALGRPELARKVRTIDPFMHTMEGIREHIAEFVEAELKGEMETYL